MVLSDTNRDLFIVALRVWIQFNSGLDPAPEDVQALKQHARRGQSRLRIDDLACEILIRELAAPIQVK